ncbi:hypothetical protein [Marinobacterium lutimaris]|uniref:Uncharacterized protein n=1 Tax=Marinobacterium lutimaris TaxID=568106 RepID=A0A1H6C6S5_9GAMM|nr:hypothetical protein [Marinobacterium lutimaris]SEG68325.1 hypothetical protein SAMN05444390_103211 [Marinobacterium lutimaris]
MTTIAMELEVNKRASAFGSKYTSGLTKREYIATQALSTLISNPELTDSDSVADRAVEYADALLRKLSK